MNFRGSQIYISRQTKSDLWLIAKSRVEVTPDQVAEEMLRAAISEKYPEVAAHRETVESMEERVLANITSVPQP